MIVTVGSAQAKCSVAFETSFLDEEFFLSDQFLDSSCTGCFKEKYPIEIVRKNVSVFSLFRKV